MDNMWFYVKLNDKIIELNFMEHLLIKKTDCILDLLDPEGQINETKMHSIS